VTASASLTLDGAALGTIVLRAGSAPAGTTLPPGPVYRGNVSLGALQPGTLAVTVNASNAGGSALPVTTSLPVVAQAAPTIGAVAGVPASVPLAPRLKITVSAPVHDGCGVGSVTAYVDTGRGFRRAGKLTDRGRRGDAVAGDGIFTGRVAIKTTVPGTFPLHLVAKDRTRLVATGADVPVVVSAN
jgi:hypothetical protein